MSTALEFWLPLVVVGILTLSAMAWDLRLRRIPNFLTIPAFLLGIAYQSAFRGLAGLEDAAIGFCIGFGTLLMLWLIGGGGAGDVKLMGALSVWIGARLVTQVLIVSVVLVWLAAVAALILRLLRTPASKSAQTSQPDRTGLVADSKSRRHVVAFAVPVGIATWLILALQVVKAQAAG